MSTTLVEEVVAVKASFNGTLIKPEFIAWRGRVIPIDQVNLVHHRFEGRVKQFIFSVSNNSAAYKLEFNTENLMWKLLEIYTAG